MQKSRFLVGLKEAEGVLREATQSQTHLGKHPCTLHWATRPCSYLESCSLPCGPSHPCLVGVVIWNLESPAWDAAVPGLGDKVRAVLWSLEDKG